MRTRLFPLSPYDLVHLSKINVVLYSLFVFLILAVSIHAIIILARIEVLNVFTFDHFSKAEQVAFQMHKGLDLTQSGHNETCSKSDLARLRDIKKLYSFIGILGRTSENKIICTTDDGVLDTPIDLPPLHTRAPDGKEYRNSQTGLIQHEASPPMITYKNAVASPSYAYLKVTTPFYTSDGGVAGITYYNGDKRYIHRFFGQLLPQDFDGFIAHNNSWLDWFPIANSLRTKTLCNNQYHICTIGIDREVGLYHLSRKTVMTFLPILFLISIVLGGMVEHFRVGPRALARKLRKQIQQDNIFPVYQPQVKIDTQEIIGVESLARWNDPKLGYVSPEVFIPIAEETGLIEKLTQKLMVKIFGDLHEILEANKSFVVSINISTDLLTSDTFVNYLNHLTATYRFNRNQVILEVTERTASNQEKMSLFSKKLQAQGYLVSIDDFGTGVSNLSWLSMLEPNEIKVDKAFTQAIDTETVNSMTLDGIFSMLEHLNVKVVFEGVETERQRDYIYQKIPNAIGQGWLFAKPQHVDDLKNIMKASPL